MAPATSVSSWICLGELGLGNRFPLPWQRSSGSGIVEVPGHEVDVQVRHGISEPQVVHVARREHPLDHPHEEVNVAPVRGDSRGGHAREVRDVPCLG
jgi:hypothetical protein